MSNYSIKNVSVPINPRDDIPEYVPSAGNFILEGVDPMTAMEVLDGARRNVPVMIVGPTGSGKSSLVKYLCSQTNNGYLRMQLTGATTIDEFLGRMVLDEKGTKWQDGMLLTAMKKGLWFVLDELNMALPEIVTLMQSLLDDDKAMHLQGYGGEKFTPHPDFRLFSTINPWGDYAGTKELNKAFQDRFAITVEVDYPKSSLEVKIIQKHSGLDPKLGSIITGKKPFLDRIVEFGNSLRHHEKKGKMAFTCSTRQLINWACALENFGIKDAAKFTILNKIDTEEELQIAQDELDKLFQDGENEPLNNPKVKPKKSISQIQDARFNDRINPVFMEDVTVGQPVVQSQVKMPTYNS